MFQAHFLKKKIFFKKTCFFFAGESAKLCELRSCVGGVSHMGL